MTLNLALIFLVLFVVGVVVTLVVSITVRRDLKDLKECLPKVRDFERQLVAELVIVNYLPPHLKSQVEAYFRGELGLEDLKGLMSHTVEPDSGFIKYASKQAKEKNDEA